MRNEKYWQYYKTKKIVPFFHRAGLCQAKIYRPFGILIFGRNAGTLRGTFREGRRNRGLSPFIHDSGVDGSLCAVTLTLGVEGIHGKS